MKIYLAGRYERRLELVDIAKELKSFGHEITSRWLDGSHDNADPKECATIDLDDIDAADAILLISENGANTHSRGGRHFEFGYAYALGKTMILFGKEEGVFHYLPEVNVISEGPTGPHHLDPLIIFLKDS